MWNQFWNLTSISKINKFSRKKDISLLTSSVWSLEGNRTFIASVAKKFNSWPYPYGKTGNEVVYRQQEATQSLKPDSCALFKSATRESQIAKGVPNIWSLHDEQTVLISHVIVTYSSQVTNMVPTLKIRFCFRSDFCKLWRKIREIHVKR